MPAIGFRSRFFLTVMAVLLVVTGGAIYLYSNFLQQERLKLIDHQLRESATVLLNSDLAEVRWINTKSAEAIIVEELGESRIGKFFVVRNAKGKAIFESDNARVLPLAEMPRDVTWFHLNYKNQYIRALNLKLPSVPDRSLQVGVILDQDLLAPGYMSRAAFVFIGVALLLGLLASWFLTSFLLKPISQLDAFLSEVSQPSRHQLQLPQVPASIAVNPSTKSHDEFERMLARLNGLIDRVNKNYQFSRLWAYQMAHELKTPLSLLSVEIEKLPKKLGQPGLDLSDVDLELQRMSETINSFLSWAELENSNKQRHLFVNRLGSVAKDVIHRIQIPPERVQLLADADVVVVANPQHLEQLISNLVQNAVVHTPAGEPIVVRIQGHEIEIEDRGAGLPKEVLERLGEPFNRGDSSRREVKGHGLGLAWVKSVCRLYGWELEIDSDGSGTCVRIVFPEEVAEPL